jgi:hypothetical protein
LWKHIRVHRGQINIPQTDEKKMNCWNISEFKLEPHCCTYCSKSFAQSGGLRIHIRALTGQKFTFLKLAVKRITIVMTSVKEKSRHFNDMPGIQNGGTWLDSMVFFSYTTDK